MATNELKELSLNKTVYIRLTEKGRKIHRQNHEELWQGLNRPRYIPPSEDQWGWSKWILWELMQAFGAHLIQGMDPPFETVLRIDPSSLTKIVREVSPRRAAIEAQKERNS